MDKQAEYLRLVKDIRKCHLCTEIKVPSFNEDGECLINDNHGIDDMNYMESAGVYVNRWNLWQGNLDADIMVLGQDYGYVDVGSKQDNDWKQNDVNKWLFQTDRNLYKIFKKVFHYDLKDGENLPLFFTNIACCYRKKKSTGVTNDGWFSLCANKYMGRLIRIVQPKVIVCLGMKTFEYLAYCDDMKLVCVSDNKPSGELTLTKLLDDGYKFELRDNKGENAIPVVPVFHPGANMARNRVWDKVTNDWAVVKDYLHSECKYDEDVLKRVERYAFQQLDGINHSDGYYRLDDYVYFEHKGKMIFDPWQNEKFQYGDCIWVEYDEFSEMHKGEHVVDSFEYYGADAMNDFIERMLRQVEGI